MTDSMRDYLDACKAATSTKSDRNLARKIGVSQNAVYEWRAGKSYPSNDTMVRLAERANLDPAEAVILLNLWKSHGKAKAVFASLLKTLGLIPLLIAGNVLVSPLTPANAHSAAPFETPKTPESFLESGSMFIMRNYFIAWKRFFRRVLRPLGTALA